MKNASRLLMSGAALALALINATPVSAEGYWTDGWTVAICDHARQAFAQLPDLQAGAHMYIIHADGTRTDYTMVSRYYASWSNGYVTLDDGRDPWNGDTQLFLQTCINASGTRDIITYWEPIAE